MENEFSVLHIRALDLLERSGDHIYIYSVLMGQVHECVRH